MRRSGTAQNWQRSNVALWDVAAFVVSAMSVIGGTNGLALGPQSLTLLVAGDSQRRVAFLPWVPLQLKALKPKDWTHQPVTLGEHIKKVRKERGLLQRNVAKALGVDSMSIVNWEKSRTKIEVRFVPAIIEWLGYDPLPRASSFGSWIAIERTRRGLARRALADALGWDERTVRKYEEGDRSPDCRRLAQLRAVLGTPHSS